MIGNLTLRTIISPYADDVTRNSVMSFSDVDNNFLFLKGNIIYTADTNGNMVTLKRLNGEEISFLTNGEAAVTGGTYNPSSGTATFTNSTGGTFNVTGFNIGGSGGDTYWTSGSTGNYSIKTINNSGLDATGNYAVSEGYDTLASGQASHAEGHNTTASGNNSHTEGTDTTAGWKGFSVDSIVDGVITLQASYGDVTSEFVGMFIISNFGKRYAYNTVTFSSTTHTEILLDDTSVNSGGGTIIVDLDNLNSPYADYNMGDYSHAEGYYSRSLGYGSHAEGGFRIGNYIKIGGLAIGQGSHAEGAATTAIGEASHAEGGDSKAIGDYSHAEGIGSYSYGDASHAEGRLTTTYGNYSHSEGFYTTAIGNQSHAGGQNAIASGDTSFIHSKNSIVLGNRSVVLGGQNITGSINDTVYVPYLNVQSASTDNAITEILVIDTNGDVKKRDVNTIGGGSGDSYWTSGSTGNYSVKTINDSTTNATGNYAVAEGYNTTASGNYSTASGYESIAGWKGFTIDSVVDGLITLNTSYGDVTGEFTGNKVILDTKIYVYNTVTFSSTTNTQILLDDTTAIGYNYVADINNLNSQYADNYIGISAHAEGYYTIAGGNYGSHAEGYGTIASGNYSHAEGRQTIASGLESHAEGEQTKAIGDASHAEGASTIASGNQAHAEGEQTIASGDRSHAEGYYSLASGYGSHAEGGWNDNGEILSGGTALGKASHAEGQETIAGWKGFSVDSTVSGVITLNSSYGDITGEFTGNKVILDTKIYVYNTVTFSSTTNTQILLDDITASGVYVADLDNLNSQYADTLDVFGRSAHAEGNNTKSLGVDSHAEGWNTIATGAYGSHAEGDFTTASGDRSHAEGERTTASGNRSHAEGELTTASGMRSHAEGYLTVAQGHNSHAEGNNARSLSNASHAEGSNTTAIGENSHAEGQYTISGWRGFTVDSVVNGLVTINLSYGDITSEFTGNKVILDERICIYNTVTFSSTTNTEILLNDLTINGGYLISDIDNLNSALADNTIGVNGHVEGFESKALGENSPHAEGIGTIASGNYSSHAEGGYTLASGNYSHAEGYGTIASGDQAHAEGQGNIASGVYSHAEGNNTKSIGDGSHAEGQYTTAIGDYSHAEGNNTIAIGWYSHAGGGDSIASGDTSFIHSKNSLVTGNRSAVLGGIGITGTTDDTVYVPYLNVQSATTNNTLAQVLVIDTNGNVKKRDVSSISGESSFTGGTVTGATSFTNNLTVSGGTSIFSGNSSSDLVRITQDGSGNALVVEDVNNPDGTPFVIDANGNVGMGTLTPQNVLHVKANPTSTGTATIRVESDASTSNSSISYYSGGVHRWEVGTGISLGAPYEIYDRVGGQTRFSITTSGAAVFPNDNVGIGTITPSEKLDISGAIKIQSGGYTSLTNGATTPVPTGGAGTMVFDTVNSHFFGWNGTSWRQLDN
jgi:hypothetical protein